MPRYNLRSGAAAQDPLNSEDANNLGNEDGYDLNNTIVEQREVEHSISENIQLSSILEGINNLTKAVSQSRLDIEELRRHVHQRHSLEQIPSQSTSSPLEQQPFRQEYTQNHDVANNTEQHPSQQASIAIEQQPFRLEYAQNNIPSGQSRNLVMNSPANYLPTTKMYDLPIFSGKAEEWPLFFANFQESTNEFNYNNRQNLMRLQKCLIGNAKEATASMLIYPNDVPKVIQELEFRFGRPDLLVRSQLLMIQQFPAISAKRLDQVLNFATKVRNVVAFLKSAKCSHHLNNTTLLEELVSKLPIDKQYEWARFSMPIKPYPTIEDFSVWIGELANVISIMSLNVPQNNQTRPLMLIEDRNKKPMPSCYFCHNQQHTLYNCRKFIEEIPVEKRWEKVKELKLCFCCLKKGHSASNCRSKRSCGVNRCKRPHHPILHEDRLAQSSAVEETQCLLNCRSHLTEASSLFKIIPIQIFGPTTSFEGYAIFDEGSSISLMDESISRKLGLKGKQSCLNLQWYGGNVVSENTFKVSCEIEGVNKPKNRFAIKNIYTVNNLNLPMQSFRKSSYPYLSTIPIDDYESAKPVMLLGLDNSHLAMPFALMEGGESNPIAIKTKLGWMAYGPASTLSPSNSAILHIRENKAMEEIHNIIEDYFATENFGLNANASTLLSDEDQIGKNIMEKTINRVGERFEIGLLWKKYPPQLPNSYSMALKRLLTIENKMHQDPQFGKNYILEIEKYLQKGYARKLSDEEVENKEYPIWYLPHFGVTSPHKPGKIRVVFDAAAKIFNTSLNAALVKGPEQAKPLRNILLQFREGVIGVAADIREMFSQVKIRKEDQHAQRFLWRNGETNKQVQHYLMISMTFGAICSPCCAEFVKNHNATDFSHQYPEAADAIINKHYVDDFVCSFNNEDDAIRICQEVVNIHSKAGFELRGFVSNNKYLETILNSGTCDLPKLANSKNLSTTDKILGMYWNKSDDTFRFQTKFLGLSPDVMNCIRVPTKREMLKIAMSVFDPFGLIADFLLHSMLLVQYCWKENVGWDEPIPDAIQESFKTWWSEFKEVRNFKIPRCFSPKLHKAEDIQLHTFVDASQHAFTAVCYLRITYESNIEVCFVIGKVRCAPKKVMSIPRLELQAAVLGIRLSKTVMKSQGFEIPTVHYRSDSQTVISWISSTHRRFKAFVNHRVAEILENSRPEQWNWIPTKLNSADTATRPKNPPKFVENNSWVTGPEFLKKQEYCWPRSTIKNAVFLEEEVKPCLLSETIREIIKFSRFSTYVKLKRTIAWVLRFIKKCHSSGPLSVDEIMYADIVLCRIVQRESFPNEIKILMSNSILPKSSPIYSLTPYLDENGLLRVNGRLDEALFLPLGTRRPIILPQRHYVSKLILQYFHEKFHHQNYSVIVNEVRQKYWIVRIKSAYKTALKECTVCKFNNVKPSPPLMGTLPADRITPFVRPFSYTGVDLFGPFNIAIGRRREKRWPVIFTCLTTRAAHIEIAENLSADAFILCFRNFVNRRGTPVRLRSDNGTNFIASQKLLKSEDRLLNIDEIMEEVVRQNIDWVFNCPANPSSGGCWERLIRIVKRLLVAVLKEETPRLETFRSILIEAENIINSRPLTEIPLSSEEEDPITPNHFLLGCLNSTQTPKSPEENICLRKQWRIAQNLKDRLWKRWVTEYLPQLLQRPNWREFKKPVETDDFVLVIEHKQPRHQWLKGRVIKTYPSKDSQVRFVDVKTENGVFRRPVSKLAVINLSNGEHKDCSRKRGNVRF